MTNEMDGVKSVINFLYYTKTTANRGYATNANADAFFGESSWPSPSYAVAESQASASWKTGKIQLHEYEQIAMLGIDNANEYFAKESRHRWVLRTSGLSTVITHSCQFYTGGHTNFNFNLAYVNSVVFTNFGDPVTKDYYAMAEEAASTYGSPTSSVFGSINEPTPPWPNETTNTYTINYIGYDMETAQRCLVIWDGFLYVE